MPLTVEKHLDDLVRHINLVRDACLLLGRRLIANGETEFGRNLISRGFKHDITKFHGVEWEYLHAGTDIPKEELALGVKQHVMSNDHHPEFWGGFHNMPEIAIAEMVCDWYGRSMEFGTGLRDWIDKHAVEKYGMDVDTVEWQQLTRFVDLLLENQFIKEKPKKQRRKK